MSSRLLHAFFLAPLSFALGGILAPTTTAQNLVPNPSFELKSSCPTTIGQTSKCIAWSSPTSGTPDYHNACATLIVDVPNNTWGSQNAHTGSAYVSCISHKPSTGIVREYVEAKLTSALVAGEEYDVAFHVSLTDKSRYAIAEMGAYLSKGSVSTTSSSLPPYIPQVLNSPSRILDDKINWMKISGTVIATGGETHIVIGCFKPSVSLTVKDVGGLNKLSNYYVDDVSVTPRGGGPIKPTPHIIGWAELGSVPPSAGYLDIQNPQGRCEVATRCRTASFKLSTTKYAGGTAYDPRNQTVWISDGANLGEYYLKSGSSLSKSCASRCKILKATIANANASVSGLAHDENDAKLYQLSTTPGAMEITTYDTTSCPVKPTLCRIPLKQGQVACGLAHDEINDYLYISVSTPSSLIKGAWDQEIWINLASDPCKNICKTKPTQNCVLTLITGLAFDSCARILYATDGSKTQAWPLSALAKCTFTKGWCCTKSTAPRYKGLALIPGWTVKRFGKSCAQPPCEACHNVRIGFKGALAPGNTVEVSLDHAPIPAAAIFFGKIGGCGSAGLVFPYPFCGGWYAIPPAFLFAGLPVTGSTQCCGNIKLKLKLPPGPKICGLKICLQWYFVCKGTKPGPGTGLTDAIELTVVGS
jgi:hypothetical protein